MFQESLGRALTYVKGARACMLIGFDGIPIASVFAEDDSQIAEGLSGVAVEVANMLGQLNRNAATSEVGYVAEVSVVAEKITALARVVDNEYLLILAVDHDTDMDKGARVLRLIGPWVEQQM